MPNYASNEEKILPAKGIVDMTFGQDYSSSYIRGIMVLGTTVGDVSVVDRTGTTTVMADVPIGCIIPVQVTQVNSTGTEATQVIGFLNG